MLLGLIISFLYTTDCTLLVASEGETVQESVSVSPSVRVIVEGLTFTLVTATSALLQETTPKINKRDRHKEKCVFIISLSEFQSKGKAGNRLDGLIVRHEGQ